MSTCSTEFCKIICTKRKLALAEKSPNSLVLRYACKASFGSFSSTPIFFCTDCAFCKLFLFREKGAKLCMPVFFLHWLWFCKVLALLEICEVYFARLFISTIERPVTCATFSSESPKFSKFLAVSIFAC